MCVKCSAFEGFVGLWGRWFSNLRCSPKTSKYAAGAVQAKVSLRWPTTFVLLFFPLPQSSLSAPSVFRILQGFHARPFVLTEERFQPGTEDPASDEAS